jgi:aryl-alcohol dehydrogenase
VIKTKALLVESGGAPFTVGEVELDEPRPNEALVRIVAAGLCHTDIGVASGGLPFPLPGVLGHEGAGVVEKVGDAVAGVKKVTTCCCPSRRAARARTVATATPRTAPPGCR